MMMIIIIIIIMMIVTKRRADLMVVTISRLPRAHGISKTLICIIIAPQLLTRDSDIEFC